MIPTIVEPRWRFLLTKLDSATVSFLDHLTTNKKVTHALDLPAEATSDVRSDTIEANRVVDDFIPSLSFNDRLLYGLRLEDTGVYVARFGGICNIVEDEAGAEAPTTHLTAYDPWKLLYSRPVTRNDGLLPVNELSFEGKRGDEVALLLLQNTHTFHGTCHIDFGQTAFYGGTIEPTDLLPDGFGFDQGAMVGEAWTKLCQAAGMDIVLSPVYDPQNRPGIVCELNIYAGGAGSARRNAVLAWDKPGRSLVQASHLFDGTAMANKIKFFTSGGQGAALQSDAPSIARYGQWWLQQSIAEVLPAVADLYALAELELRKNGKETLTVTPAQGRAPWPLRDYGLGDSVPVNFSNKLRQEFIGLKRVYAIPISIDDNGGERVEKLLLTDPNA